MSLIPLRPLLEASMKYGFGQGAFNVNAVAQAKAAIEIKRKDWQQLILENTDGTKHCVLELMLFFFQ